VNLRFLLRFGGRQSRAALPYVQPPVPSRMVVEMIGREQLFPMFHRPSLAAWWSRWCGAAKSRAAAARSTFRASTRSSVWWMAPLVAGREGCTRRRSRERRKGI
jgi:hypothetical protein